jgi:enoyl-CoA hydratase/carnithine racemase
MPAEILTDRPHAHTLVLTISDPAARNALSPQVYAAGIEALDTAESQAQVRCVVLRGAGEHFCGGGDLQRLKATRASGVQEGAERQRQSIDRLGGFVETLRSFPKPVIAAVEGYAAGAGFSLVLACDLVVAAEDAKFLLSYAKVGLSPDGGASWQLARRLPPNIALEAIMLPAPIAAERARALGLVNEVVPHGQALAAALALAERLAAMPPNVLASAKELVHGAARRGLTEQLAAERDHFVANLFHDNAGEGIQAFLDKRAPQFR